ncbi:hypothetical protein FQA47_019270 [Oryzias melastigma]|uniref:Uncharacterized protein n=1 Tax=Oryzias melastigma TaxID=30732 RepID=A0A834F9F7_ORYME|nr:hypothetical protein FQA47_019270 [Oryzias melastigma]
MEKLQKATKFGRQQHTHVMVDAQKPSQDSGSENQLDADPVRDEPPEGSPAPRLGTHRLCCSLFYSVQLVVVQQYSTAVSMPRAFQFHEGLPLKALHEYSSNEELLPNLRTFKTNVNKAEAAPLRFTLTEAARSPSVERARRACG